MKRYERLPWPHLLVVIVVAAAAAFCWISSLVTKDTSWVDRLWSVVPVVYVWIFAIAGIADGDDATRLVVMAVLVTAWGARHTFDFARKGGYIGTEDYRWAILRSRRSPARGEAQGFLTTGMFAYSRHPNSVFEQAQRWGFYALGASAAVGDGLGLWGGVIKPSIVRAVLLTLLFIGSTVFTESISASKYPAYADYRRTTSMLVPRADA